jgi:hypothetical protein
LCRAHRCGDRGLVELAEHVVDVHDLTLFPVALFQHAGFEGRHFHRDLVGLEIDKRVARGYDIAFLLEPPRNGGFNDRFAQGRDFYGEHSD